MLPFQRMSRYWKKLRNEKSPERVCERGIYVLKAVPSGVDGFLSFVELGHPELAQATDEEDECHCASNADGDVEIGFVLTSEEGCETIPQRQDTESTDDTHFGKFANEVEARQLGRRIEADVAEAKGNAQGQLCHNGHDSACHQEAGQDLAGTPVSGLGCLGRTTPEGVPGDGQDSRREPGHTASLELLPHPVRNGKDGFLSAPLGGGFVEECGHKGSTHEAKHHLQGGEGSAQSPNKVVAHARKEDMGRHDGECPTPERELLVTEHDDGGDCDVNRNADTHQNRWDPEGVQLEHDALLRQVRPAVAGL